MRQTHIEALYAEHMEIIPWLLRRFKVPFTHREDAWSAAKLVFVKACASIKPGRPPRPFLYVRVRGAIKDFIRREFGDRRTRNGRAQQRAVVLPWGHEPAGGGRTLSELIDDPTTPDPRDGFALGVPASQRRIRLLALPRKPVAIPTIDDPLLAYFRRTGWPVVRTDEPLLTYFLRRTERKAA